MRLETGSLVAGRPRAERLIAAGGMGVVWSASDILLKRRVALKMLHPAWEDRSEAVPQLLNEARITASFRSEYVPRVSDVGWTEAGFPFVSIEHLAGTDLRTLLGRRGRFGMEESVDLVLQVSRALAEIHGTGFAHRDVKPENIVVSEQSGGGAAVKLVDFGIARPLFDVGPERMSAGSPDYMSPEQLLGQQVDARNDIWSLGVVLYELLNATLPFDDHCDAAVHTRILNSLPRPMRRVIPQQLSAVISDALQKKLQARIANVASMAMRLKPSATALGRANADAACATFRQYGGLPS